MIIITSEDEAHNLLGEREFVMKTSHRIILYSTEYSVRSLRSIVEMLSSTKLD
jgi:hypothetical protein